MSLSMPDRDAIADELEHHISDVVCRREAEAALQQSQRMETLGSTALDPKLSYSRVR